MVGDLEVPEGQQTVLNVGITSDPENLAPEAAMGSASFCKGVIYERLFDYNPLNISEIIPVMVESYEWLDDTHLQCTLFDHIFDTNGNQIKAEDAVWSVIHCKDTVYKQKAADIVDEETYAVDEYTFVIGYTTKNFLWSDNLAGIDIVSQKSFEESVDGMMTTPVGSGTYKLESYQDGSSMTLVRNENYWMTEEDAAKNGAYLHSQNISKIVFKIIPDATQQIIEFNAGTIDMLRQVPTVSLPDCMEDPTIDLFPAAATQMKYLYYNCSDDSQMKDVNLRRAVSYAINNDDIVVGGYDGFVNKSTQIVASWAQEYVEGWEPYPFDTAKAKECLAESNYNGEPLVIIYSAENPSDVVLAQIIMEELRAVGISSRIEEIETASFTSTQTQITTGWDICITAAKQTNTILFTYYNTLNVHANCRGHWNRYDTSGNAERFQELEDQALPDAVENFDLIKEAQAILEDQCVIYPMHEVTQYYGLRSGIDMDQLYVAPGNFYFGDFYPTADATWLLESAS
ncbi:MAG: ABC transporter substrate-binding protein [Clostridiales bacterium]|nr:ABC transporter substrate-binding protein [Clostridiales bacterium]